MEAEGSSTIRSISETQVGVAAWVSIHSSLRTAGHSSGMISTGIGARVSGLRREKGLRVADLAALVGVSPSLISQIERGRSAPSVATLFMLAKALAVPVDDLFEEVSPGGAGHVPAAAAPSGTVERAEWKGAADPSGGPGDDTWSVRTIGRPSMFGAGSSGSV